MSEPSRPARVSDRVRFWVRGPHPTGLDGALGVILELIPSLLGEQARIQRDDWPGDPPMYLVRGAVEGYELEETHAGTA